MALAITPVSVVTSPNNTIDSTLVLFVLVGAWAVLRAAETGKLRWLLLCAIAVGLGFNVKMLAALLVVPAFGLVYLLGTQLYQFTVRGWYLHVLGDRIVFRGGRRQGPTPNRQLAPAWHTS